MPVFKVERDGKLEPVKEVSFSKEGEIQRLTQDNLSTVFALQFVTTEYLLHDLRLDTLAFDPGTRSFVVLEYKKSENHSLVDQGFAYLALLLNNKADFVLEYNQRTKSNLTKNSVNWDQSRVIFVSPRFSRYQKKAIEFKDLAMELWEVRKYDNGTVLYNQIIAPDASESIKSVTKRSPVIQKVGEEIKVYSEDDHKPRGTHKTLQLYEHLRAMVLALGNDVSIKPTKFWISFKRRSNFADVVIWKSKLTVYLNASWGELKDPKTVARNVTKLGHWGMGSYEVTITTSADVYEAMGLIRQSYERQ